MENPWSTIRQYVSWETFGDDAALAACDACSLVRISAAVTGARLNTFNHACSAGCHIALPDPSQDIHDASHIIMLADFKGGEESFLLEIRGCTAALPWMKMEKVTRDVRCAP